MKKISLLFALSALLLSATAQTTGQPSNRKIHQDKQREFNHHKNASLYKNLNLTDAQQSQMKANNEEYQKKVNALKDQQGITLKEYQEGKAKLQKERQEKASNILTAEQKNQMQQMKVDRQAKNEQQQKMKMDRMTKELNLTPDQAASIKAQNDLTRQQMMALNDNNNLSREQKKQEAAKIKNEAREKRATILTPEQQQQWDSRKNNKPRKNIQ